MSDNRLIELYEYNRWACERTAESLETLPESGEQEQAEPAAGEGRGPVAIFAHMASAGLIWLMRLNRRGEVELPVWPDWSLEEARENNTSGCIQLLEFVKGVSPGDFKKTVTYRNSKGTEFSNTIAEILDHVNLHYHYHRGQLAMLVKRAGGTPAVTDYIFYKREDA